MVRVYGSAIEAKDYPVPRGDLRSKRGMRDLKCDDSLQVDILVVCKINSKIYWL